MHSPSHVRESTPAAFNPREALFSAGIFLVACAVQAAHWFGPVAIVDGEYWITAATYFRDGMLPPFDSFVAAHPATTILLPAALLMKLGVSGAYAIGAVMIVSMSLCIAIIVGLCRVLRPQSLWWLCALSLLILDPRYIEMTMPSTLASLISVVYVLLVLKAREGKISRKSIYTIGVCLGILLATRLDAGVEMLLVSLPYLFWLFRSKTWYIPSIAIALFILLNPFVWAGPGQNIASFTEQVSVHLIHQAKFYFSAAAIPLSVMGFVLALLFYTNRRLRTSIPYDYILWLLISTAFLAGILIVSPHHPARYFFPLILIWEIFLPLLAIDAVESAGFAKMRQYIRFEYILAGLFIAERSLTVLLRSM